MSHLAALYATALGADTAALPKAAAADELADRMRAAYIAVDCPACAHPEAVQVNQLKDVARALVTCGGCGLPYRRDEAVSRTLMCAIGCNPR